MIYFLGDVHRNISYIDYMLRQFNIRDAHIVQVGDFGIGIGKQPLLDCERYNERFKDKGVHVYVIRGNHDDPNYFDGEQDFSNIHFLKDYTVLNLDGLNILCIGGAISIDRTSNTEGEDYWKNEGFLYDCDKLKEYRDIDIVATHTAPEYGGIPTGGSLVLEWAQQDLNLYRDLTHERNDLNLACDILKENNNIRQWIHGHFHRSFRYFNKDCGILFRALDIGEFYKFKIEKNEN